MKKTITISVVAAMITALPFAGIAVKNNAEQRKELLQFIDYCKGCENLRQVNPVKDLASAGTRELKIIARWYYDQDNFADCTDYPQQAEINYIIGRQVSARIINK